MISGTTYEQGEIVLVPFPFTNLQAVKKRPVLILSNNRYNRKAQDVVTCGITSNLNDHDHSVLIKNTDCTRGSLPKESRIKADKLFTLEQSIIIKRLAKVGESTFQKTKQELFGLIDWV